MNRRRRRELALSVLASVLILAATPALSQQPAGEAEGAGAGRLTREQETPVAHLCAGCLAPIFTDGSKGSITPYGRVELDAIL